MSKSPRLPQFGFQRNRGYVQNFSFRADLLRGFVLEDWVKDIPGGTPSTSLAFGWDVLYWISPNSNGTFPISPVDFDNLNELQEVKSMLAERVIEWTEEWEQQGLQEGLQEGRQEECISLVTRLLIRKFGIHPELGPSLVQLQNLPVEKLEGLTEAIFDWVEVSDFNEWLTQQLAN